MGCKKIQNRKGFIDRILLKIGLDWIEKEEKT